MKKIFLVLIFLFLSVLVFTACNDTVIPAFTEYTICFNANGGTEVASVTIGSFTSYTLPESTKQGYAFDGWYLDEGLTNIANIETLSALTDTYNITLYAKWSEILIAADVKAELLSSVGHFYDSTKLVIAAPSAEEETRYGELNTLLGYDSINVVANIADNLDRIESFDDVSSTISNMLNLGDGLTFYTMYRDFNTYKRIYVSYNNIADITASDQTILLGIADSYNITNDTLTQKYNTIVSFNNMFVTFNQLVNQSGLSLDTYGLALEYSELAPKIYEYQLMVEGRTNILDKAGDLFDEVSGDIRLTKIRSISEFLSGYDYTTIICEEVVNYSELDDFIIDFIDAGGFTSDDIAILLKYYLPDLISAVNLSIDKRIETNNRSIELCNQRKTEMEEEIYESNDENTIRNGINLINSYNEAIINWQEEIDYLNQNKTNIAGLNDVISIKMLSDYSEIILMMLRIGNSNNIIDYFITPSEETPTFAELEVMIGSFKGFLRDFVTSYGQIDFSALMASIEIVADEILIDDQQNELFYLLINSFILNTDSISKAADIIDLVDDADTLNIFLNIEDGMFVSAEEKEYLLENLAILEARAITTLIGNYNEAEINDFYNSLALDFGELNMEEFLTKYFIDYLGMSEESADIFANMYSPITEFLIDNISPLSEPQYNLLVSVSEISYSVTVKPVITDDMYNALPISRIIYNILDYHTLINDFTSEYINDVLNEESVISIATMLYLTDIDKVKVEALFNYIIDNIDNSSYDNFYIFSQLILGIFSEEVGFTNEDITNVLKELSPYFIDYLIKQVNVMELETDISGLIDILNDFKSNPEYISDIAEFALEIIKSLSLVCYNNAGSDYSTTLNNIILEVNRIKTLYALAEDKEALYYAFQKVITLFNELSIADGEVNDVNSEFSFYFHVISTYITIDNFDDTFDKLTDILQEIENSTTNNYEDEVNYYICLARIVEIMFNNSNGIFDTEKYEDLVNVMNQDFIYHNKLSNFSNIIVYNYEIIQAIAVYQYDSVTMQDEEFAELINTLEAQIKLVSDFKLELLEDDTYEITQYIGTDSNVIVPGIINGRTITSIGKLAFAYNYNIITITLPDSIVNIGISAFKDLDNLISITIPEGVTFINELTFYSCDSLLEFSLPDSVTSIGNEAFSNCLSLENFTISENSQLIDIGEKSFMYCVDLAKIIIPIGVIAIDNAAFYGCDYLLILCEASEKPVNWNSNWNPDNLLVIWNANNSVPVNYTFVTNGGNEIDNILAIYLLSSPVTVKEDMYFAGWYDNEELDGLAVNFPYCNNSETTLYAKWSSEMFYNIDYYYLRVEELDMIYGWGTIIYEDSLHINSTLSMFGLQDYVDYVNLIAICPFNEIYVFNTLNAYYAEQIYDFFTSEEMTGTYFSLNNNAVSMSTSKHNIFFEEIESNSDYYFINNNDEYYSIIRFVGFAQIFVVPITFNGKPITEIISYAFSYNDFFITITIPEEITYISDCAFFDCPGLTIHCEVSEKPENWNNNWNSGISVVWAEEQ